MPEQNNKESSTRWVTYRPDIKVLDCTVRDGGLINDHHFSDELVQAVYKANVDAGVDYMEFGYKASKDLFNTSDFGPWKFCDEEDLRRIVGDNDTSLKISVMADAERTNFEKDILPREQSVIDCIRVACYIHQIPLALDMIEDAHQKGYETMLQVMAVSTVCIGEVEAMLAVARECSAAGVYLVDSFGSFYSEQIRELTKMYVEALEGTGKDVGIHAHNNQMLAFANTVESIICGSSRIDATMAGIGRGAGNCPMELILGFLHNPKFKMRPILKCTQDVFVPLAEELEWGYSIPYAITGHLNRHPRTAIKVRAGSDKDNYLAFYDEEMEES